MNIWTMGVSDCVPSGRTGKEGKQRDCICCGGWQRRRPAAAIRSLALMKAAPVIQLGKLANATGVAHPVTLSSPPTVHSGFHRPLALQPLILPIVLL